MFLLTFGVRAVADGEVDGEEIFPGPSVFRDETGDHHHLRPRWNGVAGEGGALFGQLHQHSGGDDLRQGGPHGRGLALRHPWRTRGAWGARSGRLVPAALHDRVRPVGPLRECHHVRHRVERRRRGNRQQGGKPPLTTSQVAC